MFQQRNVKGNGVEIMKELKELFIDLDEKETSVLYEGLLDRFLDEGVLRSGFCVLSDRRLYFKGRYFQKSGKGYRSDKGEYAVDLKDVTGSGFSTTRFGIVFFLGILFVIVLSVLTALFLRFVEVVDHLYFGNEAIIKSCLVFLVLGLIAVPIYYYVKPFRIFVIEYAGGGIAFLVYDYLEEDIRMFQKAIYKAKDALSAEKEDSALKETVDVPVPCQEQGGSDALEFAESAEL